MLIREWRLPGDDAAGRPVKQVPHRAGAYPSQPIRLQNGSAGCQAAWLPVSAGQMAQDAQWCREPRNGIETFIELAIARVQSLDGHEIGPGQCCAGAGYLELGVLGQVVPGESAYR
jgi:hypothetical protein